MKKSVRAGGRKKLLAAIKKLEDGPVEKAVRTRAKQFASFRKKGSSELFRELCFCIMTANCSAQSCIKSQDEMGVGFLKLPEKELREKLKSSGYRFHNRAAYIIDARRHVESLRGLADMDGTAAREWLAKNVKGLGFKEASHFLRNTGAEDLAIIDFHIIDLLERYGLVERPNTLNKKRYIEIEDVLRGLAADAGINLMELDLYLWYMETGKVLK
ncbi:MAG: N-glycosylase/DNA lyase [Candidatus Altiarchaeota archaeon]|nr:N-glycosylase/DNA lyase [Candidatus Altiarchaeota archaeon]